MTTPEVAKAPALFLRNATGLVKGWSAFDAFGYSFFSVNLVTLGMFYSLAIFAFVPDGSVLSGTAPDDEGRSSVAPSVSGPGRCSSANSLGATSAHPSSNSGLTPSKAARP